MKNFLIFILTAIMAVVTTGCSSEDKLCPDVNPNTSSVNPNFIGLDEALTNADIAFEKMLGSKRKTTRSSVQSEIFMLRKTRGTSDSKYGFYVVNYGDDNGFALLSADRRRTLVYALSEEGSLHLSDTTSNPGLNWYLNQHLENMETAEIYRPRPNEIDSMPFQDAYRDGITTEYTKPLITGFRSIFHQEYPYNEYCFTKQGKQAYVGCGPLAMGTIVSYYKWPSVIESYNMDWDAMYQQQYHDNWNRLFEIMGRTKYLNAEYGKVGSDGTGVNSTVHGPIAFTNLGYKGATYSQFSTYLIQQELQSKNPVYLRGDFTKNGKKSGHAWVVDGGYHFAVRMPTPEDKWNINYDYYYHVIWGWGGFANGYFLYASSLGGKPHTPDEGTYGTADVYSNLGMVYGYRPNR